MKRTEAKKLNLKTFTPDKKCKNNHDSDCYTSSGVCIQCDKERKQNPNTREKINDYQRDYYKTYYADPVKNKKRQDYQREYKIRNKIK